MPGGVYGKSKINTKENGMSGIRRVAITMLKVAFTKRGRVFGVAAILLCCPLSSALVITSSEGRWPPDWPEELSPYRAQAKTTETGGGNNENVYEIRFDDREEFEKIWPTILKLKSDGGTLRLSSIERPFDEKVSWFRQHFSQAEPIVRIYGPVHPAWPLTFRGGRKLVPGPPWPESAKWATGELPEYVTASQDHTTWVPYLADPNTTWLQYLADPNRPASKWRARIDIELVVDGKIIDLNRIRLPADTSIIDKRKPAHKQEASHDHTEWISQCIKRIQSIKPTVRNERSFSELNPHYKERAGAFYDIKYVSPSAEALFKIADVRPEQMRETLNILRAFVYEWLDAYVEGNGSILEAQVQECIRKMDSRFDALFDDLQRKQYRIWRDDASGKHNQLRFLMSPSGAEEQDNAQPADEH